LAVLALVGALISGCAVVPDPKDAEATAEFQAINDPAEPLMRGIFEFNRVLDRLLLKPVATFYKAFLPPPFQRGINNALNNLRAPLVFVHDVLQGDLERAGVTLARFAINSTAGVLGVHDAAAEMGYAYHNEDMGQTLAVWGADEGPYLVLPVFGPSNPRDAVGLAIDFLIDPFNLWMNGIGESDMIFARGGVRAADDRARVLDVMEDVERASLDFYATVRSLYRQRRGDEIRNGRPAPMLPAPGLTRAPGDPAADDQANRPSAP
jgi:phospholipid-binding lipoprotein MlaA